MLLQIILTTEKTHSLVRWGKRFAQSQGSELRILCLNKGDHKEAAEVDLSNPPEKQGEILSAVLEALAVLKLEEAENTVPSTEDSSSDSEKGKTSDTVTLWEATDPKLAAASLNAEGKWRPKSLLVAKHGKSYPDETEVARQLFREANCNTILIRPGESAGRDCHRIVIPAGGAKAKLAVKKGIALAESSGATAVPLLVTRLPGDYAEDVGKGMLAAILKGWGIESTERHIAPEVGVADRVEQGIAAACSEGTDLLILADSGAGELRRKLFGTVPDRLLEGPEGMAVAVVRRPLPLADRIRSRLGRILQLSIPQLDRQARVGLFQRFETSSGWSFDFMALICLSTAIAALGLIQNSTAVVIGAMLVAPLMTPLLGFGLAMVQQNRPLALTCLRAIVLGFLCALAIGALAGLGFPPHGLTSELAARGAPSLLDMGVAFLSGIAASYCVCRPQLVGALAGVAIAAALVPPIATTGIALGMGEFATALGAAQLFGTNVVAIILGAAINFFLGGVRARRQKDHPWIRFTWFALLAAVVGLGVLLWSVGQRGGRAQQLVSELAILAEGSPGLLEVRDVRALSHSVEIQLLVEGVPDPGLLENLRTQVASTYGSDHPVRFIIEKAEVIGSESE